MPSVKQGGGYTLTFSKKNIDVKHILDIEKEKGTVITNYICDAIRFYYENYDDTDRSTCKQDIESMVAKAVGELLKDKLSEDRYDIEEEVKEDGNDYNLEDCSGIDDFDLEED